ncbi:cytidylate kinase family protein [Phocaeicola coprocola]|nr:cytidylate kinase family protein [Phocaeicola coprocola]MBV4007661.1 cytidylate kinase family protein [Phocaeicola coprocola]MBV4032752.1 cytidylate kinase family protein [Phocaeicola coprocola]MBV4039335.1 cytidylate kinase family protein [Phocaeicola coprocola]MBV4061008.1 cytidylate kinase family protein [Phocaeicola coprocola]
MNKYMSRRYILFAVSLFVNAMGIAFITKALLGTSPITSVTYVLSMFTPLTIGQWTIVLNLLFVLFELPFMTRKELKDDLRMFLLQIPISLCFGTFIDLSMNMLYWLEPVKYIDQIIYLLVGCVILAAGITLEVKANVAMMAGEYFVRVISQRFHGEFGYVKLCFDITLVCIACLFSICFMSGIYGVREGTVAAALLVGPIVHFISPYYRCFDKWINDVKDKDAIALRNIQHVIITIAREYGSGGHLLGEMLSKELGIKLYDKEFIHLVAEKSGINEQYIKKNEQSIPSFWLKCILGKNSEQSLERSLSSDDVLFVAESKIIQELAEKGPCIIVGRCADFVLRDYPNLIKVFCYSDLRSACVRCVQEYGVSEEKAESEIKRINHNRIAHYEYYTGEKWGEPHHYNLMINTGSIDLSVACNLIKSIIAVR